VAWASVVFAAIAAGLWLWSALVNLPVIGSSYGAIAELEPFYRALRKVGRLNASAAGFACLSAACQAYVLLPS
jgi:hypothetical protein